MCTLCSTYSEGHIRIHLPVHIHMTDALAVTQHRYAFALILDAAHQLAGSPRDDQIYVLIQLDQVFYVFSSAHLCSKI